MIKTIVDGLLLAIPAFMACIGYKTGLFYMGMKPIILVGRVCISVSLSSFCFEALGSNLSMFLTERLQIALPLFLSNSLSFALIFSLSFILSGFILNNIVSAVNSFITKGALGRVNSYLGMFVSLLLSVGAIICAVCATEHYLEYAGDRLGDFDRGIVYRFISKLCQ